MWTSFTIFITESSVGVCNTLACVKASSTIMSAMDPSGDPCDDFYQFACGRWRIPIPDGITESWAVLKDVLYDNLVAAKNILGMHSLIFLIFLKFHCVVLIFII